ncbi:hypothetical protein FJY63_02865 [Candidatus Sumerlaeota bacterium]|nr:hypothetical protein [Candidatus Sumerlaeota bacterium]
MHGEAASQGAKRFGVRRLDAALDFPQDPRISEEKKRRRAAALQSLQLFYRDTPWAVPDFDTALTFGCTKGAVRLSPQP